MSWQILQSLSVDPCSARELFFRLGIVPAAGWIALAELFDFGNVVVDRNWILRLRGRQ